MAESATPTTRQTNQPTPEEVAEAEVVVVENMPTLEMCEAAGGVWQEETSTCGPMESVPDAHEETEADQTPLVVENPVLSTDGTPIGIAAQWWSPGLGNEALQLVDPNIVGADDWHLIETEEVWGTYRYYRFYHGLQEDTPEERELLWNAIQATQVLILRVSSEIYYPYRFDLSWVEYPNLVSVLATFPRGEQVEVPLRLDGEHWTVEGDVTFPEGPPIRPTTPFTEPRFPETAQALGRDCPPVEELWERNKPVEDPCTLTAIQTALEYVHAGATPLRVAAIRDGHVLAEGLALFDNVEDPFLNAFVSQDSRDLRTVVIRDAKWSGGFAQASMILAESRVVWPERELTDEEREAAIAAYQAIADSGQYIPERFLQGDFKIGGEGLWDHALIVRTADGTWRMSYRSSARYFDLTLITLGSPYPDDPTPHFPDSDIFDLEIEPPNKLGYYTDPRQAEPNPPRLDAGLPRLTDEYLGVPPS